MGNLSLTNGYGVAGYNVVTSLQRLGHRVPFASPSAPVELAFCQPDYSSWSNPDAYHIQYTPWESSVLPDGWVEAFNDNSDEVWTTSPLIAQWYKDAGVEKPIYVYQHGVESIWTPKRRYLDGKLRFLHVGEPAGRKGGQETLDTFRAVFGDREDVHLTIKAWTRNSTRAYVDGEMVGAPDKVFNNVTVIRNEITQDEMVKLFHDHHALVYPGWGEGFGLIPLQALATGMPTICTKAWAPYAHHLIEPLALGSVETEEHPWDHFHHGTMFKPNQSDLVDAMWLLDNDYDYYSLTAFKNAFKVTDEYDWDVQTERAFAHIVEKFS
jgi:glycosyltransferase involved in cell wall biosynthesis